MDFKTVLIWIKKSILVLSVVVLLGLELVNLVEILIFGVILVIKVVV